MQTGADEKRVLLSHETSDSIDEISYRDGFGHIGFATTFADFFLVPLHREGSNGNNGNRLDILIILDSSGDVETRYFRQLDIHKNEVGMVIFCQFERLTPFARL